MMINDTRLKNTDQMNSPKICIFRENIEICFSKPNLTTLTGVKIPFPVQVRSYEEITLNTFETC